jgi:hypothetical protein
MAPKKVATKALSAQERAALEKFYQFEKHVGPMTIEHLPEIDWTKKTDIEKLFPKYKREMLRLEAARTKNISKAVNIEDFNMKTLYGDGILFENTKLIIENSKRSAMYGANGTFVCLYT